MTDPNRYLIAAATGLGALPLGSYDHGADDAAEHRAPRCPGCGLVMSGREAAEQGECNECHGGPADLGTEAW